MAKALYRTYRSSSFDEVLGQDHITSALKNALKSKRISHAYLFTGPRGVGKTSVARILAYQANGLEYSHDSQHVDIIEIDAASNRRIDEIRDLRERVMIAPTSADYKIYIIDEVHMLTREAFNALLKTLEEPPSHVIFILATTEFHKLPDTIVSRCLHFNFKPIETRTAMGHLRHIASSENLDIDDEALELIADYGNGSFRDSISRLDQLRGLSASVTADDVRRMLGMAPNDQIKNLLNCILAGDPAKLLDILASLYSYGAMPSSIAKQLSMSVRQALMDSSSLLEAHRGISLLQELLGVQASTFPKEQLEVVLLGKLLESTKKEKTSGNTIKQTPVEADTQIIIEDVSNTHQTTTEKKDISRNKNDDAWLDILAALKAKNNTLYSIARMAHHEFRSDKLILTFNFAFHHKQMNESKNKTLINEVMMNVAPHIKSIQMELSDKNAAKPMSNNVQLVPNNSAHSSITNIFGGAEVLES